MFLRKLFAGIFLQHFNRYTLVQRFVPNYNFLSFCMCALVFGVQWTYKERENELAKKNKSRETQSTITAMLRRKCIKRGETRNKHLVRDGFSVHTKFRSPFLCIRLSVPATATVARRRERVRLRQSQQSQIDMKREMFYVNLVTADFLSIFQVSTRVIGETECEIEQETNTIMNNSLFFCPFALQTLYSLWFYLLCFGINIRFISSYFPKLREKEKNARQNKKKTAQRKDTERWTGKPTWIRSVM